MHFTIDDSVAAEGDKCVARWTWEGTDMGGSVAFGTPPTGKHVKFTGTTIRRFEGGKVVEAWTEADYMGLSKKLQG
jgi:predicted ester cyclase